MVILTECFVCVFLSPWIFAHKSSPMFDWSVAQCRYHLLCSFPKTFAVFISIICTQSRSLVQPILFLYNMIRECGKAMLLTFYRPFYRPQVACAKIVATNAPFDLTYWDLTYFHFHSKSSKSGACPKLAFSNDSYENYFLHFLNKFVFTLTPMVMKHCKLSKWVHCAKPGSYLVQMPSNVDVTKHQLTCVQLLQNIPCENRAVTSKFASQSH